MVTGRRAALLGAGALALTAPGFGARAQMAGAITVRRGVEYAVHDGTRLVGDLYAPQAAGRHPALVAVHGGGWQAGNPMVYQHMGPWLAQRGHVIFAAAYRLSGPGRKTNPEAIHDIRAAVQFVRGSAAELNVDPERIGLIGDSAGGHLAAMVALAGHREAFAGAYRDDRFATVSTRVKALVSCYGVHDMIAQWQMDQLRRPQDQITERFMGFPPMQDRRAWMDASPITYATLDANQTSVFLIQGTEDDIVDRATQFDPFLLALKQARFFARSVVLPGAGHFFMADPVEEGSYAGVIAPHLLRFLQARL